MSKPHAPGTIYLIPGPDEDGAPGLVWCDDPAPSYADDPADAIEYRRADTITPTLEDMKAWADGIHGALGTEFSSRVTEDEALLAHAILTITASGEG